MRAALVLKRVTRDADGILADILGALDKESGASPVSCSSPVVL